MRAAIRQILFSQTPFHPRQLFAAGEQGVWYDPSDFGSMFQDAAGTTPVTAIEQPVGRILDKSGRGNHASQSTTTSRPILRNLYNLLQRTEEFSNAAWGKNEVTVPVTNIDSPIGTTTACEVLPSLNSAVHRITQNPSAAAGIILSVYVKANGYSKVAIKESLTTGVHASFDLSAGTVLDKSVGTTATITSAGSGWYLLVLQLASTVSAGLQIHILAPGYISGDPNISLFAGNGTSSVYVWGASIVTANDAALPYQRVVTNTPGSGVYDTDPSKFLTYLFFDGTDDWLATGNIDFSATDKMSVFAGVRKLSDSQQRIIAELSATIASNNGSFMLSGPNSAAANYNFSSKGTSQDDNTVTAYAAPISNVITGLADIAAPTNIIRINQVATALNTSQGTGNYGNFPLYIGRRGGTTLPFSGRIYSLIIRGALTNSPQLEQTERFVAAKTGVTL